MLVACLSGSRANKAFFLLFALVAAQPSLGCGSPPVGAGVAGDELAVSDSGNDGSSSESQVPATGDAGGDAGITDDLETADGAGEVGAGPDDFTARPSAEAGDITAEELGDGSEPLGDGSGIVDAGTVVGDVPTDSNADPETGIEVFAARVRRFMQHISIESVAIADDCDDEDLSSPFSYAYTFWGSPEVRETTESKYSFEYLAEMRGPLSLSTCEKQPYDELEVSVMAVPYCDFLYADVADYRMRRWTVFFSADGGFHNAVYFERASAAADNDACCGCAAPPTTVTEFELEASSESLTDNFIPAFDRWLQSLGI